MEKILQLTIIFGIDLCSVRIVEDQFDIVQYQAVIGLERIKQIGNHAGKGGCNLLVKYAFDIFLAKAVQILLLRVGIVHDHHIAFGIEINDNAGGLQLAVDSGYYHFLLVTVHPVFQGGVFLSGRAACGGAVR